MSRNLDLGKDNIWKLVLGLAIPTALAQAVTVLYAIVDRMFIGHMPLYGDIALAGVGVASPITTFISSFATLIGMGASPIMAMKEGHGERKEAERIITTGFYLLLAVSAILLPLFFFLRNPILLAFGASSETLPYASEYFAFYVLGTPFSLLATGLNSFLINQGYSKRGMISVLSGALLNIALDPVFIFTLGMGVKGAAIATVLSQILSSLIVISFLRSRNTSVRLHMSGFSKRLILPILKYGVSSFIIISTDSILLIILNSVLQRYGGEETGDLLITAATIVQSYHILVTYPMGGMTAGCQGLASYNFGAGLTKRVGKTINNLQIFITAYSVAMFFFTLSGSHLFASLFTSDEEMIALSSRYMFVFECMVIPLSFQYVNVDMMTALGEIRIALPLSLTRKISFFIATVTLPVFLPASSAFLAEGISDLLSGLIGTLIMRKNLPGILQRRAKGDLRI